MTINGRALAAEALGTLFLLATVVGSGIMAERLSGGNVAVALLGNTIATGAMLYVLISLFGPISGAQFNPAVTLALGPRNEALPRFVVQTVAAILGVWLAHAMFGEAILQWGIKARTGPAQWLSEGVATFGLIMTIMLGARHQPSAIPALVGLYITAAYWFTASTSFANPAVTIARSLTTSFAGIAPTDAPAFIAAQFVGAFAAKLAVERLWPDRGA